MILSLNLSVNFKISLFQNFVQILSFIFSKYVNLIILIKFY